MIYNIRLLGFRELHIYHEKGKDLARVVSFRELEKAIKLHDNLQSHILILLEEISHSSSSQLRFLLEELIKVRDE